MPIILSVDELKPGMRLMQAIHRDRQTMLAAGKCLEEWEINSLRRRFPDLTVQVGDPVLDEWVEFQDDSHDHRVGTTVNRQMQRVMKSVRDRLSSKTALDGSDIAGLQKTLSEVINYINENPATAAILARFGDENNQLQEHSGNVFYLSLLIGNAVREYVFRERVRSARGDHLCTRYAMNLTPLALGCLFHDLGMLPIERYYAQKDPLSPEDLEAIRQHPLIGLEMLPKELDAVAKMVVRTHHENYDGTGYPAGITGHDLHIFSRIIRIADAYDAGTNNRVYRKARSAARILWEMSSGENRTCYDPTIVKILMGLVQPFPIGAKIRLDSGQYGVVVRHNRKHPFRPVIILAFDEENRRLKKQDLKPPIDLAAHEEIRLREFVSEDLDFLNRDDCDCDPSELNSEEIQHCLFDLVYP